MIVDATVLNERWGGSVPKKGNETRTTLVEQYQEKKKSTGELERKKEKKRTIFFLSSKRTTKQSHLLRKLNFISCPGKTELWRRRKKVSEYYFGVAHYCGKKKVIRHAIFHYITLYLLIIVNRVIAFFFQILCSYHWGFSLALESYTDRLGFLEHQPSCAWKCLPLLVVSWVTRRLGRIWVEELLVSPNGGETAGLAGFVFFLSLSWWSNFILLCVGIDYYFNNTYVCAKGGWEIVRLGIMILDVVYVDSGGWENIMVSTWHGCGATRDFTPWIEGDERNYTISIAVFCLFSAHKGLIVLVNQSINGGLRSKLFFGSRLEYQQWTLNKNWSKTHRFALISQSTYAQWIINITAALWRNSRPECIIKDKKSQFFHDGGCSNHHHEWMSETTTITWIGIEVGSWNDNDFIMVLIAILSYENIINCSREVIRCYRNRNPWTNGYVLGMMGIYTMFTGCWSVLEITELEGERTTGSWGIKRTWTSNQPVVAGWVVVRLVPSRPAVPCILINANLCEHTYFWAVGGT